MNFYKQLFKTILISYMHVRTWIPCRPADKPVDKSVANSVANSVDKTVGRPEIDTFLEKFREKTFVGMKLFV